jgi:eukaryotic-like serine/threonine-protein kinase
VVSFKVMLKHMPETRLIGLPAQDTPPELRTSQGYRRRFPPDLLRQASRRLEILALVGASLWILGPAFGHLALALNQPNDARWSHLGPTDTIAMVGVLISLSAFLFARNRDWNPELLMDLALGYMVACAACIGLMIHWGPPSGTPIDTRPMITWTGPVILMFAALMPASPWKMAAAGFVAATMDPLGMIVAQADGTYHFGPLRNAFLMHYPNYLLLGVAVVISRVVTRLGREVAREREMGSYRLGELLGTGGMGSVYRATHRMLARPAAIKLIRPEVLASRDRRSAELAVARFKREADAAAKLRSPHTVELYDFGETEDGTLFFVMELLEGMDLESLVRKQGPLPQQRVIHILRQVCDSLEEAHASGLIHRDIKPANIHVGRVGLKHDFVKVLDFGLVKSVLPGGGDSMATAAGLTPGTPAYLAPEMALGEPSDGRADIYALGGVAYFLLTGQLVFQAVSGLQMITKHIQESPVPPSERTELDVAPELDRIVLACLAKRPVDRPASATELEHMLASVELEPWSEEAATEWWRTHQPA